MNGVGVGTGGLNAPFKNWLNYNKNVLSKVVEEAHLEDIKSINMMG
jgi:hypothetical protein